MKLLTNEELMRYWRKNPDKFVEEFFGVYLSPYKKALLKLWRCWNGEDGEYYYQKMV